MEQPLDQLEGVDIAGLVETMLGACVARFQNLELSLPESKDIGFDADDFGGLADLQSALVSARIRNKGLGFFGLGLLYWATASTHERGFLPLLTSSLRTSLALNDSTRRESIVIGSPV